MGLDSGAVALSDSKIYLRNYIIGTVAALAGMFPPAHLPRPGYPHCKLNPGPVSPTAG